MYLTSGLFHITYASVPIIFHYIIWSCWISYNLSHYIVDSEQPDESNDYYIHNKLQDLGNRVSQSCYNQLICITTIFNIV